MQAVLKPHNVFPSSLNEVPEESRLIESFGVTPGAIAVGCLLGTLAVLTDYLDPDNHRDVIPLLLALCGLLSGALLFGGWEFWRRRDRTTLVVYMNQLGIYHGNVLVQIAPTSQIIKYKFSWMSTLLELLFVPVVIGGLKVAMVALQHDSSVPSMLGVLGFCLASLATLASLSYSRIICRHYCVPKGADTEEVMFPENVISRFSGSTEPRRGPGSPVAAPPISPARRLQIGGGLIVLLLLGGYLLREHSLNKRANEWSVDLELTARKDALILNTHGVPRGGIIEVLGKEQACDDRCRIMLSRSEVRAEQLEVAPTLHWRGRSVRKSVARKPFEPLVTFEKDRAFTKKLLCEIRASEKIGLTPIEVESERGLTLHAQGTPGDTIAVGGRLPDEPGAGKDYSFSVGDLRTMLVAGPAAGSVQSRKIVIPVAVQSVDRVGWKSEIVCDAEMLRVH